MGQTKQYNAQEAKLSRRTAAMSVRFFFTVQTQGDEL